VSIRAWFHIDPYDASGRLQAAPRCTAGGSDLLPYRSASDRPHRPVGHLDDR
jgi:hypothetical protein